MVDDVLRMRATIVNEEALANIRAIGREIGLLPAKAKPGIKDLNTGFAQLGNTIKQVGSELKVLAPGLTSFGLGAAGAGLAIKTLTSTLTAISGKIVELKYASKELGMSERDIRAWGITAQKAGLSTETLMQGFKAFRQSTEEMKYHIGSAREELIRMGAGPVLGRLEAARTMADKLKVAFDFKEVLEKSDPTGFKARMFFTQIGLGADAARLTLEEYNRERDKMKPMTQKEIDDAKKFNDEMINLEKAWSGLLKSTALGMFPQMTEEIKEIEYLIGLFKQLDAFLSKWMPGKEGANPFGRLTDWSMQKLGIGPNAPASFGDRFPGGDAFKPGAAAPGGSAGAAPGSAAAGTPGSPVPAGSSLPNRGGAAGGPAALSDEAGNPIDHQTMQEAQGLAAQGDVTGMEKLFSQKGYRMSGPACGMIASKYAKAAGFKPPAGGAIATNWHNWGEGMKPEDINAPGHTAGSMYGTYNHGTYGGHQGQSLKPGDVGGHVGMILPGSYDPKTGTVDFVDQGGVKRRSIKDMDLRFAGADAVKAASEAGDRGGASGAGVNSRLMGAVKQIESGGNPNAVTGKYKGLYQLSDDEFSRYGGKGSIFDPQENARVAELKLKDEGNQLSQKLGRPVSEDEIYLAHQQGVGGAYEHLKNPDRPAWQSMYATGEGQQKGEAWAKKAIWGNVPDQQKTKYGSVDNMTSGQFSEMWKQRYARAAGTDRIDKAVNSNGVNATGNVKITVNSNGTAAKTDASADGLWQKTTVQNYKQMQPTSSPASRIAEGHAAFNN